MKKKILKNCLVIITLWLAGCLSPSAPTGIKVIHEDIIDTGSYCRTLGVNDSLLFVNSEEQGVRMYRYQIAADNSISVEQVFDEPDFGQSITAPVVLLKQYPLAFTSKFITDGVHYRFLPHDAFFSRVPYGLDNDDRDYIRHFAVAEDSIAGTVTVFTLNRSYEIGTQNSFKRFTDSTHVTRREMTVGSFGDLYWLNQPVNVDSVDALSGNAEFISYSNGYLAVSNSQIGITILGVNDATGLEQVGSYNIPGAANALYSDQSVVFTGLKNNFGCYTALLDSGGTVVGTLQLAVGYSVNGIHSSSDRLALACGKYGVLFYEWSGSLEFTEIGWIPTDYAYDVKIYDAQTLFVATRAGVEIFKIDY